MKRILAGAAILLALSACSTSESAGRPALSPAPSASASAAGTGVSKQTIVADGPMYSTLEDALRGEYSGNKDRFIVSGSVTRQLGTTREGTGEEAMTLGLYELEIDDDLGSGLAGSITLVGFDSAHVQVVDSYPPHPEAGMSGIFVIAATAEPGEAPFGKEYGRPFNLQMYLEAVADGVFVDPQRPKVVRATWAEVTTPARGAGQRS